MWACKVLAQAPSGEAELYTTHTAIVKELNNNSSFHPMALDALRLETHRRQGVGVARHHPLVLRHSWRSHNTGLSLEAAERCQSGASASLRYLMRTHLDHEAVPIVLHEISTLFFFQKINLHAAAEVSRRIDTDQLQLQDQRWLSLNLQATIYIAIISILQAGEAREGDAMPDDDVEIIEPSTPT